MDSERATQNAVYDDLAGSLSNRIACFQSFGERRATAAEHSAVALAGICFTTGIMRDNQLASNNALGCHQAAVFRGWTLASGGAARSGTFNS